MLDGYTTVPYWQAINLSILDFKSGYKFVKQNIIKTINLSILDFKFVCRVQTQNFIKNYKSIHIGF